MSYAIAGEMLPVPSELCDLARRASAGDRQATEAVLREIVPSVRNLVRYLVRGDRLVDDLAQDALIAVVRGLPTWRSEGPFRAWANRVVVRAALASLARQRRQEALRDDEPRELRALGDAPDEYARRRAMVELLDGVPDAQRQMLVLHHVLGMTAREAAEHLEIPYETARSRLRLGTSRFRELVRATEEAEEVSDG